MRLTFKETSIFTGQAAELLPDDELNALQWALMANPESGDLIRGSGGLRKLRWAGSPSWQARRLARHLLLACAGKRHPSAACLPEKRTGKPYARPNQSPQIHHRNRIPMKDELFQQLAASLKEGGAILRGKKKPARSTTQQWPDAKSVREKLNLSQVQFAALIGISPRTLQNWEQGHRRPEGTARALLRVAESHPQAVLEALHR